MLIPIGIMAGSVSGAAGAYELITTRLVTSNLTAFTLSGIPAETYKHLEVRFTLRNGTATNRSLYVRPNGSTASIYANHSLRGDGSSVTSTNATSQGFALIGDAAVGYTATAGIFGAGVISILDYASTSKNKTIRSLAGRHDAASNAVALASSLWASTAAITSITFQMQSGTIGVGSRFSLYGVKA